MTSLKALLPRPMAESQEFWAGCNNEQLLLSECRTCHNLFYYPRIACPRCGGQDLGWRASAGRGKVHTYSHVHTSFFGATWEDELPYTVVVVDLDEGPRLLSRLIGDDREAVKTGMRIKLDFVEIEGQKLPFCRLDAGS
jgi:uncharacterized OB-fold protein